MRTLLFVLGLLLLFPFSAAAQYGLGGGTGLVYGGSSSISSDPPASGVDSEMTIKENSDYSGTHSAGIRIDSAVDLPTSMVMDAGPMGVGVPRVVTCYSNDALSGNRSYCTLDQDSPSNSFRASLNVRGTASRYYDPPGANWGLRLLALSVHIGNASTADHCDISVETNITSAHAFDFTAPYVDSFVVQGTIESGPIGSNSVGWGTTPIAADGDGYMIPLTYVLNGGYFVVTARDRDPLAGTPVLCDSPSDMYIRVYVQEVYIP